MDSEGLVYGTAIFFVECLSRATGQLRLDRARVAEEEEGRDCWYGDSGRCPGKGVVLVIVVQLYIQFIHVSFEMDDQFNVPSTFADVCAFNSSSIW